MTTGGEGASGGAKMLIRTGLVSCCALCLSITMHANAGHPLFDVVRQGDHGGIAHSSPPTKRRRQCP